MNLKKLLKREEKGQGLVEYALILVLVAIVVIAILLVLGPQVGSVFSNVVANFNRVTGGGNDVEIQQFTVSGTGGSACTVKLQNLRIRVTKGGQPVPDVTVVVNVALQAGGGTGVSVGPTSGGGIAQASGVDIGTDPNPCGGRTATASAPGATATDSY